MEKIHHIKIYVLVVSLLAVLSSSFVFASASKDVYQYNLDNGLTLFVAENHNVPLVYIEIAVRAGAVSQTAETAGLFHLYEHMMFKGNALYPNAASFDRASQDMGVAGQNGSTGIDYVNYFFTVPTNELENGLAFWNAAVRSPLMRPDEFENEKRVVLAEIEGRKVSPGTVYHYYRNNMLFPDEPYRLDAGGSFDSISNATIEQLREMQATYYIPSNTALFVGGDVNPKDVFELVKKIYGNWSDSGMVVPQKGAKPDSNPLAKITTSSGNDSGAKPLAKFAVMPYDQMSPDLAQVAIDFRGPDADFDLEDTYVADYLLHVFDEPEGIFKQTLLNNTALGIPDADYAWSSYATARASGVFNFGSMLTSPHENLVERVNLFLSEITDNVLPQIVNEKSLYQSKKRNNITGKMSDDAIWRAQTAAGILHDLRFWWTVADDKYYYSYSKNIAKVRQNDAKNFVEKYIDGKTPLVTVLVNPAVYESIKDDFENAGYELITSDNAYWFNDERFAGAADNESVSVDSTSARGIALADASSSAGSSYYDVSYSEIYKPSPRSSVSLVRDGATAKSVTEKKLANGIPVYVQQDKNARVASVYVAVRGGIRNLTPETSGLEGALFSMMSRASEKYDYTIRQNLVHEKNFSISTMSRVAGSALSLNVISSYLYDVLPVFVDGIVNPSYDETVYGLLMTDYYQAVQSLLNNPQSILSYEISKVLYENHPYKTRSSVTPVSIEQITIANMKSLHEKIMSAENIFIVAVGNVEANKLVRHLNRSLGKIEKKAEVYLPSLDVPEVVISGEPVVLTHPSVVGTGHVERVFRSPVPTSDDFMPAVLAADIYSNVLYQIVREHYGACYTPQSFVSESKAPTGGEYLYRLSNFTDFSSYMQEARNTFANGNTIDSLDDEGNYIYAPLAERLDSYKNTYINETYASEQTMTSVAGSMTYNLLQYDDLNFNEKKLNKLYNASTDDVLRVFKKYWIDEPARWFVIVGPENGQLRIKN